MSLRPDVYQIVPLDVLGQGGGKSFADLKGGEPGTIVTVIAPPQDYGKGTWQVAQLENGKYTIATETDPRLFAVCEKNVPLVEGVYPSVVGDIEPEEWEIELVSGEADSGGVFRIKRDGLCWSIEDGVAGDVGLPISLKLEGQGSGKNLWNFDLARLGIPM